MKIWDFIIVTFPSWTMFKRMVMDPIHHRPPLLFIQDTSNLITTLKMVWMEKERTWSTNHNNNTITIITRVTGMVVTDTHQVRNFLRFSTLRSFKLLQILSFFCLSNFFKFFHLLCLANFFKFFHFSVSQTLLVLHLLFLALSGSAFRGGELNGRTDSYSPHHYDHGFQMVPSSVVPTPSPEQWSELSPHNSNSTASSTTPHSSVNGGSMNGGPPPAHLHSRHPPPPSHHHHHHQNLHCYMPPVFGHNNNLITTNGIDGKPVIQAAVLAGKFWKRNLNLMLFHLEWFGIWPYPSFGWIWPYLALRLNESDPT